MTPFPALPKPFSVRIGTIAPTLVSTAQNLRTITTSRGAHRFTFDLTYPPLDRAEVAPVWAFIQAQHGQSGTFDFTLPAHSPRGRPSGSPVVDGAGQTGSLLAIAGLTPNTSQVFRVGDYVRIDGHYKSYIVLEDVDADAFGKANFAISPTLQASPPNRAMVSAGAVFRCRFAQSDHFMDVSDALHYSLQIQLIEALS